jgi:hypothetical protein
MAYEEIMQNRRQYDSPTGPERDCEAEEIEMRTVNIFGGTRK